MKQIATYFVRKTTLHIYFLLNFAFFYEMRLSCYHNGNVMLKSTRTYGKIIQKSSAMSHMFCISETKPTQNLQQLQHPIEPKAYDFRNHEPLIEQYLPLQNFKAMYDTNLAF